MSDSEEKSLDASEKKLRDARQKGQTASFRDLSAALGFVAGAGVIAVAAGGVVDALTTAQSYALSGMDRPFLAVFPSILAGLFGGLMLPFLAMLGAQVLAVTVGAIAAHKGFVFSLEPIALKLTNLDPIKGLGRIFGVRGVVEFCKSVVKVAVLMAAIAAFAVGTIGTLPHLVACGFDCTLTAIGAVFWPLFALFSVFLIVTGVFDVPIQTFLFNREMKMGQSEMKRERKDMDGTPEIKAEQRRLREELAEASGGRPTAST
ncbi:MAG: EscU/YscU/HrcU family type III secretion system export apparatus switch protein, partial [Pseudomonadota bacterium]